MNTNQGQRLYKFSSDFCYKDFETSLRSLPVPYLKLSLDIPVDMIYREWLTIKDLMVPHRAEHYENHQDWYALCLHGLDAYKTQFFTQYGYEKANPPEHQWTEIAKSCPNTVEWIKKTFPSQKYFRIRYMLLKTGGRIDWHTDNQRFILGPINISITNPEGCAMHWRDWGTQPWEPGQAYLMNVSYEHMVENLSNKDRLHMIIDPIKFGTEFDDLMTRTINDHM
jgi:hypothetical protein